MAESSKRMRIVLLSLENQGCEVTPTNKGWFVKFPNGDSMTLHRTDSDHRAEKNTRARVRRAGLEWPFDNNGK